MSTGLCHQVSEGVRGRLVGDDLSPALGRPERVDAHVCTNVDHAFPALRREAGESCIARRDLLRDPPRRGGIGCTEPDPREPRRPRIPKSCSREKRQGTQPLSWHIGLSSPRASPQPTKDESLTLPVDPEQMVPATDPPEMDSPRRSLVSAAVYSLGFTVQRAIGLLMLPLYTRALSPTEYGALGVLLSASVLLGLLLSAGLEPWIIRNYVQLDDDPERRRCTWTRYGDFSLGSRRSRVSFL